MKMWLNFFYLFILSNLTRVGKFSPAGSFPLGFFIEEKFMDAQQLFCLSGFGYLEKISFDESKCIAQIKAISHDSQDEIYLDCEIRGVFEEYLYHLYEDVKKGNSVIVSFKAA